MQNVMMMLSFCVLDHKDRHNPLRASLDQNFKIACLKWLYPEIDSDVHSFCFRPKIFFLDKFSPKIQDFLFKLKCSA